MDRTEIRKRWRYRFRYSADVLRRLAKALYPLRLPLGGVIYWSACRDYDLNRKEVWRDIEKIQHPNGYKPTI